MKTTSANKAKSALNEIITFLHGRGYVIVPGDQINWEHKLAENIYGNRITDDNYFFQVNLAPAKWPQLEEYPEVNAEEKPYKGLIFSLTCQRWYEAKEVEWISHNEKEEMIQANSLSEADIFSVWVLRIRDFPLFSNNSHLLHPDGKFLVSMEKAETFIIETEKKMEDYFAIAS